MVCLFGGGNLKDEIFEYQKLSGKPMVALSSFNEARGKIPPSIFYTALRNFNALHEKSNLPFLWHGRRLIGVDGCCVNTRFNPSSPSFMPSSTSTKGGYNQYKANLLVDLLSYEPMDIALQPISRQNEHAAALGMLAFNPPERPCVLVGDRAFSTYPLISEIQNIDHLDFIIRSKNGNGAMKAIRTLGREHEEFDIDVETLLVDNQSSANRNADICTVYVNTGKKRGGTSSPNTYVSRFSQPLPYLFRVRAVQVKLPNTDSYELLLTSLSRDEFSAADISEGYRLRWQQELFHRYWKYGVGISHMLCKLENFSQQEIYGSLLAASAIYKIINAVKVPQKETNKYKYELNAKQSTILIKKFLKTPDADPDKLLTDLSTFLIPIRLGRTDTRNLHPHTFVPFEYRVP
jgi:hypothetical protein